MLTLYTFSISASAKFLINTTLLFPSGGTCFPTRSSSQRVLVLFRIVTSPSNTFLLYYVINISYYKVILIMIYLLCVIKYYSKKLSKISTSEVLDNHFRLIRQQEGICQTELKTNDIAERQNSINL